jgi:hypothetical protein
LSERGIHRGAPLRIGARGIEAHAFIIDSDFDCEFHNVVGEAVVIDEPFGLKYALRELGDLGSGSAICVLDNFVDVVIELVDSVSVDYFVDTKRASAIGGDLGSEISSGFALGSDLRKD